MIEAWPIDPPKVKRIGQGVCADCRTDRQGKPRPHNGVDIFADSGTQVLAPVKGRVIRVVDGRQSDDENKKAAGLWIDIEEPATAKTERRIHRFLHLGSSTVRDGQRVSPRDVIAVIADAGTSGIGESGPHLHYEIRKSSTTEAYGEPIDPRFDLADAVAAHAWNVIPTIAHLYGVERYGDPRFIHVANSVRKVWNEPDPEKRMVLAHEADEEAKKQMRRSFFDWAGEGVKRDVKKNVTDPVKEAGKEALKEAAKEVKEGITSWWDDLSTGWKIGVVAGGVAATAAVVKSIVD